MKNIITIAMLVWMLFVAGFTMLKWAVGWAVIASTSIMVIIGGIGYFIYKKYFDNYY